MNLEKDTDENNQVYWATGSSGAEMRHDDVDRLVKLLAKNAMAAPANVGVQGYFRSLIMGANLPPKFQEQRGGGWTGDASFDARELVNWALQGGSILPIPDTRPSVVFSNRNWEAPDWIPQARSRLSWLPTS